MSNPRAEFGKVYRSDPWSTERSRAEASEREALDSEKRGGLFDLEQASRHWLAAFGSWRRMVMSATLAQQLRDREELLDRAQRAAGAAADVARRLQARCLHALVPPRRRALPAGTETKEVAAK